jgi:drug/metabolite transporter (DMT)-like permease
MVATEVSTSARSSSTTRLHTILPFAVIYLAWGGTFAAIRVAVSVVPAFLAAGVRFFTAGLLLYAFTRARGAAPPARREWRSLLLLATLVIFIDYAAYFWGERFVASGPAAMIAATIPLITGLLEMLVFRQRPFRWSALLAIAVGISGVLVLVSGQWKGGVPVLPMLALLLGTGAWSLGMVLSRSLPLPSSRAVTSGAEMLIGGTMLLVLAAAHGDFAHIPPIGWRPALALVYLILVGSLLAFTCFVWLLARVSAGKVASHAFVNPVVAVALGAWLLGEPITTATLLGMALILSSVVGILCLPASNPMKPIP